MEKQQFITVYVPVNSSTNEKEYIYFNLKDECQDYCNEENAGRLKDNFLIPQEYSYLVDDGTGLTVAYATDRNLYKYLPTVINSLLINNPDAKVYVFAEDDKIEGLIHPSVTIINMNIFDNYMSKNSPQSTYYLPRATFVRLWIADVIPESKVLWLDVDTIVNGNLKELNDMDMGDNIIAAVLDCSWKDYPKISDKYVNAGVMLFNLDLWRKLDLTVRATKMLNNEKWQYGDQDIINKLCKGRVIFLNPRYNQGRYINIAGTISPVKIYHWPGKPKQWDSTVIKDQLLWKKYYTTNLLHKEDKS